MTIAVKDASNATVTINTLDDLIAVVASAAKQDTGNTALAAILAKLTADPATQTTLAAVLAKLSADPATQTTLATIATALSTNHSDLLAVHTDLSTTVHADLAAVLAKLTADPATQTTLAAVLAKLSSDPATQTTLAAIATSLSANHSDLLALHTDLSSTVHSDLIAPTPAGEQHIGEVGGNSAVVGGSFSRPANTTAYASGQLVANNTTAASVTPIACAVARKNAGTGVLTGLRLSKTTATLTNASFRVHLFKTSPTSTVGDGGTFAGAVNGIAAIALGYVDITMDQAYSDGAKGFVAIQAKAFDAAAGSQNIFALIEARATYAPGSGETFTVTIEALRD